MSIHPVGPDVRYLCTKGSIRWIVPGYLVEKVSIFDVFQLFTHTMVSTPCGQKLYFPASSLEMSIYLCEAVDGTSLRGKYFGIRQESLPALRGIRGTPAGEITDCFGVALLFTAMRSATPRLMKRSHPSGFQMQASR